MLKTKIPAGNAANKRRLVLKSISCGGVAVGLIDKLPGRWQRPLVHIGMLPVHAQTTLGGRLANPAFSIAFDPASYTAGKGGSVTFTLRNTIFYRQSAPVTVEIRSIGGSAALDAFTFNSPQDQDAVTLSIEAGQLVIRVSVDYALGGQTHNFTLNIPGDGQAASGQTLILQIQPSADYDIGSTGGAATLTIN